MNPLRSVGSRLALGLFLAVVGALLIVYGILVPSLERRLTNSKLGQLEKISREVAHGLPGDQQGWQIYAGDTSGRYDVRIAVFTLEHRFGRSRVSPVADSQQGEPSADIQEDPLALAAGTSLTVERGTVHRSGTRFAEVAVPLPGRGAVLLLSVSLRDSLGTIHLVQRRLLAGGLIALLAALAFGYAAASLFARRIRRLERAANRIAGGRFDQPVVDSGSDEVGELASAFERMRQRLGELDHARREFIANASHELRTPVFSLGGFLELLDEEELDDETRREFLGTMREQVERLARLATDLLDLSRLDAGQLSVEQEHVELADSVAVLAAEFGPRAQAEGRSLEVVGGEAAVAARADEQRVLQIGRIFVENALVHTPPRATIRLLCAATPDSAVALSVEDDGPGISAEKLPHVFERFYRADGAVASGSGLGLAIARDLAKLMGGRIAVESRPGHTVFMLVLPADRRVRRDEGVFTGNRSK